jgi:hypothetical protein
MIHLLGTPGGSTPALSWRFPITITLIQGFREDRKSRSKEVEVAVFKGKKILPVI